jgi:AraC-like DNA-binding protein
MDIILAIGSFNAFIFAYLIFNKNDKQLSDRILACWMILFGVNLFTAFITLKVSLPERSVFAILASALYIEHFPFLYIYTKSLTDTDFRLQWKQLLHSLPFVLMLTGSLPLLLLNPAQQKQLVNTTTEFPWFIIFAEMVFAATFIYYIVSTMLLLKKHKQLIKDTYSYRERINLVWLRHIVIGFISLLLLTIVVFALSNMQQFNVVVTDEILYLGLALMVFYVGYWGYRQGKIFYYAEPQLIKNEDSTEAAKNKKEKTDAVNITERSESEKLLVLLRNLMKEEKPYLDPELNIITLSAKLNMHPHKLSKLLNSHLQQNFFDFINQYRVEEFKSLALDADYKNYSILAIAYDAGFNSKASFNRIFKNITGHTPSQYIKSRIKSVKS